MFPSVFWLMLRALITDGEKNTFQQSLTSRITLSHALSPPAGAPRAHRHSHSVPNVKVMIMSGPPTLKYAQALIVTAARGGFLHHDQIGDRPQHDEIPRQRATGDCHCTTVTQSAIIALV
jgi:hypothetical protein